MIEIKFKSGSMVINDAELALRVWSLAEIRKAFKLSYTSDLRFGTSCYSQWLTAINSFGDIKQRVNDAVSLNEAMIAKARQLSDSKRRERQVKASRNKLKRTLNSLAVIQRKSQKAAKILEQMYQKENV